MSGLCKFSKILLLIVLFLALLFGCLYYYLHDHHQFYRKNDYILEGKISFMLKNDVDTSIGDLIDSNGYYFCIIFPDSSAKRSLNFSPFREMTNEDKRKFEKDILKSFYSQDENHRWLVVIGEDYKLVDIFKLNPNFINSPNMHRRATEAYCINRSVNARELFSVKNVNTSVKEF